MSIEEAKEKVLKLVYDYCFKEEENEAIDVLLLDLDKKDKEIQLLEEKIAYRDKALDIYHNVYHKKDFEDLAKEE